MTINELEQAIRNLIASQPMITSGPSGEVINSALSIVYSFREFMFRLQAHPFPDALKMNMQSATQSVENDLVISICQIMQERGINLMLYSQAGQFQQMPPMNFQRPVIPQASVPPQMMYGANQMPAYSMPQQPFYGQANFVQPPVAPQQATGPRRSAPNYQRASMAVPPQQTAPREEPPAPAPRPKPKEPPIVEQPPEPAPRPAPKTTKKQAVEALVGESVGEEPSGKSAGRDYLLELLKK